MFRDSASFGGTFRFLYEPKSFLLFKMLVLMMEIGRLFITKTHCQNWPQKVKNPNIPPKNFFLQKFVGGYGWGVYLAHFHAKNRFWTHELCFWYRVKVWIFSYKRSHPVFSYKWSLFHEKWDFDLRSSIRFTFHVGNTIFSCRNVPNTPLNNILE